MPTPGIVSSLGASGSASGSDGTGAGSSATVANVVLVRHGRARTVTLHRRKRRMIPNKKKPTVLPDFVLDALRNSLKAHVEANTGATAHILQALVVEDIRNLGFGYYLVEEGGPFACSTSWVKIMLGKMGYTHRASTAVAQHLPDNWEVSYLVIVLSILTSSYLFSFC